MPDPVLLGFAGIQLPPRPCPIEGWDAAVRSTCQVPEACNLSWLALSERQHGACRQCLP